MANPRVRPHLRFYPEDAGQTVNEYWQASHWHEDMDPTKSTPMVTIQNQQYFVHEPCLLNNGLPCMPTRWFLRDQQVFAKAWTLRSISHESNSGWIVEAFNEIEVSADQFLVSFGNWPASKSTEDLPRATQIFGEDSPTGDSILNLLFSGTLAVCDGPLLPWAYTDAAVGNRWRALANGARVYCFPIWLYCDDTSGNLSKKWNKHNSFLFTPAGLPRAHVHQEYNIHFLCTSNIAPPLEMLDGIVDQLE